MTDQTSERRRLNWSDPLYAILGAIAVFIPLVISPNGNDVIYIFVVMPSLFIMGLCTLVYAAFRKNLRFAVMLLSFWAVSALLFVSATRIRSGIRWLLWSSDYKNEVLAQPASTNGDFKHIEWDGWGYVGIDTDVFLVFDPTDSLAAAVRSDEPGKFNGIPCKVPVVHRMESHWYTVMFYTGQSWGQCK